MLVAPVFDFAVELHPLKALPFVRGRKWIKNERCLSAASFVHFPFFAAHKREPEGQWMRSPLGGPLLLLTFSWRSKKSK
jgi:hypothetical protein